MPELPEVETMRRGIEGIVGACIEAVEFHRTKCRPIQIAPSKTTFRRRVQGKEITFIGRLGKRVQIHTDSDVTITLEPRMTGLVLVTDPPTKQHLRVTFALSNCEHDSFSFWDRRGLGSVHALNSQEMDKRWGPHKLGPDALVITAEELRARLRDSRRDIKVALLDQKVVAGIGNLYASEILHLAKIHPATRCNRVAKKKWAAIHEAMLAVLHTAIRYEGSTLSDGTYRNALNQDGSYQNEHRVYDRTDTPCLTCGQKIKRIVQAQRSTFFCPSCQKK
ncbi:MAG: bifunctional DNA-formamidopyrimidine glycosylase/DNA-(apurinic or apyrimidinic site) lyase [Planctomycetales bacterium]|nr:bifunctional DNA-formamidopyrimidine glycosylase/DNA-(apurinic or apyrimidinic site) lyase [Planctomycetales bacterium]